MPWRKHFKRYLRLLHFIGILPATFSNDEQKLVSTASNARRTLWMTLATLCIVEGLLIWTILFSFRSDFHLYGTVKTGDTLALVQLITCAVIQLTLSAHFFTYKQEHIQLLNTILEYGQHIVDTKIGLQLAQKLRQMFLWHLTIFLIFIINLIQTLSEFGVPITLILCTFFILGIHFSISTLILSIYISIAHILHQLLIVYNLDLIKLISQSQIDKADTQNIRKILYLRLELISICTTRLNLIYGIPMCLESCYVLCTVPTCPYMLLMLYEWNVSDISIIINLSYKSVLLVLSPLLIYIQALGVDSVSMEANKTSKILSNVPRTGTGIEKMIEKFLLKNLRPKPILTAYGFFSLDKSTLFKLFTAIFTYMVILVQFKEMESSTKYMSEKI